MGVVQHGFECGGLLAAGVTTHLFNGWSWWADWHGLVLEARQMLLAKWRVVWDVFWFGWAGKLRLVKAVAAPRGLWSACQLVGRRV
jgi:hypothetical protein